MHCNSCLLQLHLPLHDVFQLRLISFLQQFTAYGRLLQNRLYVMRCAIWYNLIISFLWLQNVLKKTIPYYINPKSFVYSLFFNCVCMIWTLQLHLVKNFCNLLFAIMLIIASLSIFFSFYRWRLDLYLGWQNLRLLAVVGTKDFSKSLTLLHIIFAAVLM